VAICEALDCLPLALELAASATRAISARQIAQGLSDPLGTLGRGARTGPERHRTLQDSIAWSYDLLPERERVLFRRLGVFVSSFDLDTVDEVVGGTDVLASLSELIDRSLVSVQRHPTGTRYRLLDTIRAFALERLAEAGEVDERRERHLAHLVRRAKAVPLSAYGSPRDDDPSEVFTFLDLVHADVVAALRWASTRDPVAGLRLASLMTQYWLRRGRYREGEVLIESLLAAASDAPPELRAWALYGLSDLYGTEYDFETSARLAEESARAADEASLDGLAARVRAHGAAARMPFDPPGARAELEELIEWASSSGDRFVRVQASFYLGTALLEEDVRDARRVLERCREFEGPSPALSYSEIGLVMVRLHEGRLEEVAESADEMRRRIEETGSVYWSTWMRTYGAIAALYLGHTDEAVAGLGEVAAESAVEGPPMAWAQWPLALHALAQGDMSTARAVARSLYTARSYSRPTTFRPFALAVQARAAELDGDLATARSLYSDAVAATSGVSAMFSSLAMADAARFHLERGDVEPADELVHAALDRLVEQGNRLAVPPVIDVLVAVKAAQDAGEDAVRLWGANERLRSDMGMVRDPVVAIVDPGTRVEVLRGALGDERFERAREAGAGLTLDDTVAWLRRGRGPRRRPTAGWDSLTPTERKVAELVAQGLTNPEVGERLFISRKTVSTHVSHVFDKLGLRSRSELAALVARNAFAVDA
jgi:predicted ATPase/DNA-binding CsgD family transcriptional regulator